MTGLEIITYFLIVVGGMTLWAIFGALSDKD